MPDADGHSGPDPSRAQAKWEASTRLWKWLSALHEKDHLVLLDKVLQG